MKSEAIEFVLVLVETMGPANIGSVARSAAAFGLDNFRLVQASCQIDDESRMWACYGGRVLDKVESFDSLTRALEDVDFSVAFSRRDGKARHRHYSLPYLHEQLLPTLPERARVALVFGNEESGLKREHLAFCNCSCEIPVIASDGSLNLAHAVTAALYELRGRPQAEREKPKAKNNHEESASIERLRDLLLRCRETLAQVGYPHHRSSLDEEMNKLQTIVQRSQLENWEVRLLLGMLKQVRYTLDKEQG